jgi:hypothetical protein
VREFGYGEVEAALVYLIRALHFSYRFPESDGVSELDLWQQLVDSPHKKAFT